MNKINKQIIVIPSLILSLVICWIVMILVPAKKELGILENRLHALKEKEDQIVPEHKIQAMRSNVDSLSKKIETSLSRFFPEEQLLELGRQIDALVEGFSLKLISITPDYPSLTLFKDDSKEIYQLPLTIELRGEFKSFSQFLNGTPEFPFHLHFHEATFEKENVTDRELDIILEGMVSLRKGKPLEDPSGKLIATDLTVH